MTARTLNAPALRAMLTACLFYAAFGGLIQWFIELAVAASASDVKWHAFPQH